MIYNNISELPPLLEARASWEVSTFFISQIYLPDSSGSSYPDIFSIIDFTININQKCNSSLIYRSQRLLAIFMLKFSI